MPRSSLPYACVVIALMFVTDALADNAELPRRLDLRQTLAWFHAHGFDLLIAEAEVESAEGDVRIASAIPNPTVSFTYGRSYFTGCTPPCTTPPPAYALQVTDQAAIEGTLSGKRRLRKDVAKTSLAAARLDRGDAERNLVFEVKAQFEQVLVAQLALAFAKQTAAADDVLLAKTQQQAAVGQIGATDVLRVKTVKLEADQAVDEAESTVQKARAQLAFLLGVRTATPELTVDEPELEHYALPPRLAAAAHDSLLAAALRVRPDLHAEEARLRSAEAQLALNRRQRLPDITLSLGYSQQGTGQNAVTPPTFSIGLSAPIPILYQQQGEIRKAEAAVRMLGLQVDKLKAAIVNDFEAAYAEFVATQALARRMETGSLLATAKAARDAVVKARELGAASLLDVLQAQAAFIAANVEYQNDVARYWTAVFGLERAVGTELR